MGMLRAPAPIPRETVAQGPWEGWKGVGGEASRQRKGCGPFPYPSCLWGGQRPALPWQPDRSLIDSKE